MFKYMILSPRGLFILILCCSVDELHKLPIFFIRLQLHPGVSERSMG